MYIFYFSSLFLCTSSHSSSILRCLSMLLFCSPFILIYFLFFRKCRSRVLPQWLAVSSFHQKARRRVVTWNSIACRRSGRSTGCTQSTTIAGWRTRWTWNPECWVLTWKVTHTRSAYVEFHLQYLSTHGSAFVNGLSPGARSFKHFSDNPLRKIVLSLS